MSVSLPQLPEQGTEGTSPFVTIARHRAAPGKADELERRMLADLAATRAESGCLQFHVHRDREDRDQFVIYEVWRDPDALKAHFKTEMVQAFVRDSAPMEGGDMKVQFLVMRSNYDVGSS